MPLPGLLLETPRLKIREFRCTPSDPRWQEENLPLGTVLVFARLPVRIQPVGQEASVVDRAGVLFLNELQRYRRERIAPAGELSDVFVLSTNEVVEAVRDYDPSVESRPNRPFEITYSLADASLFQRERALMMHVRQGDGANIHEIEEEVYALLDDALASAYRGRTATRTTTTSSQKEIVASVRAFLASQYREPMTLDELAASHGVSVGHLCRTFRRATGSTIHAVRDRLRLRDAWDCVAGGCNDLTQLALSLGYSSHAHFTGNFARHFGAPPSRIRGIGRRAS